MRGWALLSAGWLFLLVQSSTGSSTSRKFYCPCGLSNYASDNVLRIAWVPQKPYVYWAQSMICDQPIGLLVSYIQNAFGQRNSACNPVTLKWDCVTPANASLHNAMESFHQTADIMVAYGPEYGKLAGDYVAAMRSAGEMAAFTGESGVGKRHGKMSVSKVNASVWKEVWPLLAWGTVLVVSLAVILFILEHRNHDEVVEGGSKGCVTTLYFTVTTFTTTGYGDIVPRTNLSQAVLILFMLVSVVMVSLLTSAFASFSNSSLQTTNSLVSSRVKTGVVKGTIAYSEADFESSSIQLVHKNYNNSDLVVEALVDGSVEMILLDGYTMQYHASDHSALSMRFASSPMLTPETNYLPAKASSTVGVRLVDYESSEYGVNAVTEMQCLFAAQAREASVQTTMDYEKFKTFEEHTYQAPDVQVEESVMSRYMKAQLGWAAITCVAVVGILFMINEMMFRCQTEAKEPPQSKPCEPDPELSLHSNPVQNHSASGCQDDDSDAKEDTTHSDPLETIAL